jgi:gluconate 2-dehydrogenase gamma chain
MKFRGRDSQMPKTSLPSAPPHVEAAPFAFLTRAEAATAAAAMGRIFPDDELGPGAIAAGTVYYLDCALSGAETHLQEHYRSGLRRLDAVAASRFGAVFVQCSPEQQDELIGAMEAGAVPEFGRSPGAPAFFDSLRNHTIEGMFCDPAHRGNRDLVGWKLLGYPGPQPGYSHAEQQLDAVIVRDRIFTAADYPLPETGS